ncbi:MAG: rhodanese-like domain-containing protein [Armatimonadetes bacterium]|nr:rhodanese-like domain-containing protein [Armatimonadota bacterium]
MLFGKRKPAYAEIDVNGARAAQASGAAALVDVREDGEWAASHAPGAVHIPLGQVPDRVFGLPAGPLHVICHAGGRSAQACAFLAGQGREDVSNVKGGMVAWEQAGLPVVAGE